MKFQKKLKIIFMTTKQDDNTQLENSTSKSSVLKKIFKELLLYAFIIFLFVFVIPTYVVQLTKVDGRSMTNTLKDDDRLLVNKFIYHFKDPERFDIVVFYPEGRDNPDEYYVKRIIGLPGETVQIKDSVIYINNEPLKENYGKAKYISYHGIASEPFVLAEDEYFVLGDNRNDSKDSRDPLIGPVKRENINGQVFLRVYPFNSFGLMTDK